MRTDCRFANHKRHSKRDDLSISIQAKKRCTKPKPHQNHQCRNSNDPTLASILPVYQHTAQHSPELKSTTKEGSQQNRLLQFIKHSIQLLRKRTVKPNRFKPQRCILTHRNQAMIVIISPPNAPVSLCQIHPGLKKICRISNCAATTPRTPQNVPGRTPFYQIEHTGT